MKYYLGVDLGGTDIKAGIVDENYNVIGRGRMPTKAQEAAEVIFDDMKIAIELALKDCGRKMGDFEYIGIGAPGSVDKEAGIIASANNFAYRNVPVVKMMTERMGTKIYIENDANAAALGEAIAGAAKGYRHVVAITLGTGIGGGIIIDGKIYGGYKNKAGELGHIGIDIDGEKCSCGGVGCAERYASAGALARQTVAAMQNNKTTKMWEIVGGDISRVNGKTAFDGYRLGDKTAIEVVNRYIQYLAYCCYNYICIFSPEILVIGGGISKEGDLLIELLKGAMRTTDIYRDVISHLRIAKLGNDAGLIGAAMLGCQCQTV